MPSSSSVDAVTFSSSIEAMCKLIDAEKEEDTAAALCGIIQPACLYSASIPSTGLSTPLGQDNAGCPSPNGCGTGDGAVQMLLLAR
eukprot:13894583-Ditylum_brightwellii.AAC.1